jgi:hypothetical protein
LSARARSVRVACFVAAGRAVARCKSGLGAELYYGRIRTSDKKSLGPAALEDGAPMQRRLALRVILLTNVFGSLLIGRYWPEADFRLSLMTAI